MIKEIILLFCFITCVLSNDSSDHSTRTVIEEVSGIYVCNKSPWQTIRKIWFEHMNFKHCQEEYLPIWFIFTFDNNTSGTIKGFLTEDRGCLESVQSSSYDCPKIRRLNFFFFLLSVLLILFLLDIRFLKPK